MSEIKSVLNLNKLVFDKILFERVGFKNDSEIEYSIEANFALNEEENLYRVTLILKGDKEKEYNIEISLTGFFSFDNKANLNDKEKNEMISKNTVAIIMPYLRSQVSLLTAQPGVECLILPPFNINNLVSEENLVKD